MSEKLQKILEEINNKTRTSLRDNTITEEELLSKDQNGVTFLEHILKNKIANSFDDTFSKSLDIAYIYYKCGESLYSFDLSEADLFRVINGERFIDLLAKNDKVSIKMIRKIKTNTEIIDILMSNSKMFSVSFISKELVDNLLKMGTDGKYVIEKYFNNDSLIREIIKLVNNPKEIINICQKYNKNYLLEFANVNALMYEFDANVTLFDFLINKNILPATLKLENGSVEFAQFLRNRNLYNYLINSSESVLLTKFSENKTLLEEIIDRGYIDSKFKAYITKTDTIKILYKTNNLSLIDKIDNDILSDSVKDVLGDKNLQEQTFLEYMIDNGYTSFINNIFIFNDNIIRILCKKGYYKLLGEKLHGEKLLVEIEPGIMVVDKILESGVEINNSITSPLIAQKILKYNRDELLVKCEIDTLLNLVTPSKTYLEYLLDGVKSKKIRCNLDKINTSGSSIKHVVQFYLTIAKKDMMNYLNELDEKKLLTKYDGESLVEALLNADCKLTLDKILSEKVKSKFKIASIIKSKELEQKNIDIPGKKENYTKNYLNDVKNSVGIGPLLEEGEELLKKLEDVFMSDGQSDPDLISCLVSGYREALLVNYQLNIQELKNLINVKLNNFDKFIYVKTDDNRSYFLPINGNVYCGRPVIDTILHETGHALHYYLADSTIPDEYSNIIQKARNDPKTLKKLDCFYDEYRKIKAKVKIEVSNKMNSFFESYYNSDEINEIEEYLKKSREEKQSELESLGIPKDSIKIILDTSFTVDEYINTQKRIFTDEYVEDILRSKYGNITGISDILDAIYSGELYNEILKNETGEIIKGASGHGISYYFDGAKGFLEMIANFSRMVKSDHSEKYQKMLQLLVGDELYNMLSDYYYNNISKLREDDFVIKGGK